MLYNFAKLTRHINWSVIYTQAYEMHESQHSIKIKYVYLLPLYSQEKYHHDIYVLL